MGVGVLGGMGGVRVGWVLGRRTAGLRQDGFSAVSRVVRTGGRRVPGWVRGRLVGSLGEQAGVTFRPQRRVVDT